LILALETTSDDRQPFNELFRGVHSLKGSGGTHGLGIITTVCHELENLLTETDVKNGFGAVFATRALAYVDILRRIEKVARQSQPDFSTFQ